MNVGMGSKGTDHRAAGWGPGTQALCVGWAGQGATCPLPWLMGLNQVSRPDDLGATWCAHQEEFQHFT